jgi:hypothetical protein
MSEYGVVTHKSIVGTLDGFYRIITEAGDGNLHDFHIPFSVSHDADGYYVDFSFDAVEHEYGPQEDSTRETIACPDSFKKLANESQQEILKKANV